MCLLCIARSTIPYQPPIYHGRGNRKLILVWHTPRTAWGGTEGAVVTTCNGCLVVHRDGVVAYCSEGLDGGECVGYEKPHLGGTMSCRVTAHGARCGRCDDAMRDRLLVAPTFVPDDVTFLSSS